VNEGFQQKGEPEKLSLAPKVYQGRTDAPTSTICSQERNLSCRSCDLTGTQGGSRLHKKKTKGGGEIKAAQNSVTAEVARRLPSAAGLKIISAAKEVRRRIS